jgi:glycosyltransferase involved in cell wall biosynthesis
MIEKIRYLVDNNSVREKMGNAARKSVEKYTSDSVIKQWYEIIEESEEDE